MTEKHFPYSYPAYLRSLAEDIEEYGLFQSYSGSPRPDYSTGCCLIVNPTHTLMDAMKSSYFGVNVHNFELRLRKELMPGHRSLVDFVNDSESRALAQRLRDLASQAEADVSLLTDSGVEGV